MTLKMEKNILQAVVALFCLVPLMAGGAGALLGVQFMGGGTIDLNSHFRYLSGLLLGIGLGFLSAIPHIELQSERFRLLTFIVVVGGIGRLLGFFFISMPGTSMIFALCMELIVTPLLCFWQHSFARRCTISVSG